MNTLEERLEARLLNNSFTKKEIVEIVSEETGVKIKTTDAELTKEAGCDDWFSIDKQIGETTDAYIEIYFTRTSERGVYEITEVDVEVYDWEE